MAGTVQGGKLAAATNKQRYGDGFYSKIGAIGGKNGHTGGFAYKGKCNGACDLDHVLGLDHYKAQCAGYKGGRTSRRTKREV